MKRFRKPDRVPYIQSSIFTRPRLITSQQHEGESESEMDIESDSPTPVNEKENDDTRAAKKLLEEID